MMPPLGSGRGTRYSKHPCHSSTDSFPIVFTVLKDQSLRAPQHGLDWTMLPASLLSSTVFLPHSKYHLRPHCVASLGELPPLTPLPYSVSAVSYMSISDRSSYAGWGWLHSLGTLEPYGDLVRTGKMAVLAMWLKSGKGWEGFQVLLQAGGGSASAG